MQTEKIINPPSGFFALVLFVASIVVAAIFLVSIPALSGILLFLGTTLILPGCIIVNPNESRVLTLFGQYTGTVKKDGYFWVNPFTAKKKVSLRAFNLNGQQLKVNDSIGNPIEIAAVIVWQIKDTAAAVFAVENYIQYVNIQSEAAVRHLANSFPYDNLEDETATITLRGGAEQVSLLLEKELNERLARAGIEVLEARISHLAYAPEIAHSMLQVQQASAIIAARRLIVEGAVGMVEMALNKLSEKNIVELDEERKAAMVSNLLVVLCGDRSVNPVVNTGTLYH
ncbi:SPFH domain-containing protein [Mucilaginibacter lappiensis]|uniref:Regulator of protease activity HflC (Stomatin/prohibitin superfamily) n=1 Tax=Mucilaginibacter lappiensis TaxID=354630 RepID=A0A1N7CWU8_9SPHI|nr:SPFH domain-containing protein [Mucilaginibacter lappiensis]MBB6111045.1 regulator of protease activity HflC (stomatin/prohibitin superfamily) [Mucilaginibacter lappiensis]MBB6128829.1 regulator of protease activity HflC (stomatin/prohibitin superfamily) [Mucilaginibacter lappiensis]SIR67944.1 SPFH domain / Band 7 family protein [Mucilaginibacter lappiensis]